MKSVVQRVLQEFIDAGRLGKNELDDVAKGVLEKMEAKVRSFKSSEGRARGGGHDDRWKRYHVGNQMSGGGR